MIEPSSVTLLLYCRAGFENDAGLELEAYLKARGLFEVSLFPSPHGAHLWAEVAGTSIQSLHSQMDWRDLVFARQLVFIVGRAADLPEADRISPLMASMKPFAQGPSPEGLYSKLLVESPDTNEGKKLQKFCKKITLPLENRLKKLGYKRVYSRSDCPQIHLFFADYQNAAIGFSFPPGASLHEMGIPRLKFPREAPSRSTLKLEEAFLHFLPAEERGVCLRPGLAAVDLGAAPGGWTYQLVRWGLAVTAVDNGPLDAALVASAQVQHRREDAFGFVPPKAVEWLVCDVVEQPRRIATLLGKWLARRWCRRAVVNLKLPMKKRYEEVRQCLELIRKEGDLGPDSVLMAKQLYHDRDEVTVYVRI